MTKPFLSVLRGNSTMPPPIWLMRQAGRYLPEYRAIREKAGGFLAMCLDPDLASEITMQPIRRYGFDAAILFSDILVVPYAMGQELTFEPGIGPILEPIRNMAAAQALAPTRTLERLQPVMGTVSKVALALPEETALIGFAGAPWTVAAYMIEGRGGSGFKSAVTMATGDDPILGIVIDRLVTATIDYLLGQVVAGAEVIQLFDSWAGLLDGKARQRWSIEPLGKIVSRLREDVPDVPIILFPRGVGRDAKTYLDAIKPDAIGLDQSADIAWARDKLQTDCVLQGNLDPAILVEGGSALEQGVDRIMRTLSGGPFVFNLGHGVVPETPPEHVAALVDLVRNWSPQ